MRIELHEDVMTGVQHPPASRLPRPDFRRAIVGLARVDVPREVSVGDPHSAINSRGTTRSFHPKAFFGMRLRRELAPTTFLRSTSGRGGAVCVGL